MSRTFDTAIVGAGIIGLALARELLLRNPAHPLLVLEKEAGVARHQTGHNSGVVHSGTYYRPGSLKAKLCVEGARAMMEFAEQHGLPLQQCGKVIVACTPDQVDPLKELYARGQANGVPGLRWLSDQNAVRELEPHAAGICGLHVPSTAITDYKLVAEKLCKQIRDMGGVVIFSAEVESAVRRNGENIIETRAGTFRSKTLVNCAGLFSDSIARRCGARLETRIVPFRGEYYELLPEKKHLVRGLIYPVPDARFPFLGVHFTRRVNGSVEAGPNAVLALKREGYARTSFSFADTASMAGQYGFWRMAARYWATGLAEMYRSWRKDAFVKALRRLVPEIGPRDLQRAGAGVRAQAVGPDGKLVDDFLFAHSEGALHVCNVPSPAATASLAIAKVLANTLADAG